MRSGLRQKDSESGSCRSRWAGAGRVCCLCRCREEESFRACTDACLVDSLRALGYKVAYTSSGPFWAIKDGNRFLQPWGCLS